MDKTVLERFTGVPDKNIREALLRNVAPRVVSESFSSFGKALSFGFNWDKSPEGDDYWRNIRDGIRDGKITFKKTLSYDL